MKIFTLNLLLICFLGVTGYSQANPKKAKPFTARILLANGEKIKGILYAATEGSIILLDQSNKETTVSPNTIQWIKVRRKGRMGRGVLIGGASGGLLGGVLAAVAFDDNPVLDLFDALEPGITDTAKSQATLESILGGVVLGSTTGALVASKSAKFLINGNRQHYLSQLGMLQSYSLIYLTGK